jgi:hypothetical protein
MADLICSIPDPNHVDVSRLTQGMCNVHYMRWLRHGDPLHGGPLRVPGNRAEFFYNTVYVEQDGCKLWPFGKVSRGYGAVEINGQQFGVHHLACLAWHGPRPAGKTAAHGPCHDRLCYNGAHLSWRTGNEQWLDQVRDGTAMLGAKNHATKLTIDEVREIRMRYAAGGERQVDLAAEFGIKQPALSALLRRATWAHVE